MGTIPLGRDANVPRVLVCRDEADIINPATYRLSHDALSSAVQSTVRGTSLDDQKTFAEGGKRARIFSGRQRPYRSSPVIRSGAHITSNHTTLLQNSSFLTPVLPRSRRAALPVSIFKPHRACPRAPQLSASQFRSDTRRPEPLSYQLH